MRHSTADVIQKVDPGGGWGHATTNLSDAFYVSREENRQLPTYVPMWEVQEGR